MPNLTNNSLGTKIRLPMHVVIVDIGKTRQQGKQSRSAHMIGVRQGKWVQRHAYTKTTYVHEHVDT